MKSKTGTREWAETNVNIQLGCEHGCRYCYARYNAVCRFGRCTDEQWVKPVINRKKVDKRHGKYSGIVMYPTAHDITACNLDESLCVLRKLLDAGNQVLIVSKPHLYCITVICEAFDKYKDQITFRFTIGSASDDVLAFWEPGAPNVEERLASLEYAYYRGFRTSISCEPFLDAWPMHVYEATSQWINDSFWFGKLRQFDKRVNLAGANDDEIHRYVEPLRKLQNDIFILSVAKVLEGKPFVRFKDSVREVVDGTD